MLTQLKLAPVEVFSKRFEEMELDWMVGKNNLDEFSLMNEAATLYRQLKNTNNWDGQLHPRDQVVVLTTKIETLNTQLQQLKSTSNAAPTAGTDGTKRPHPNSEFASWRVTKMNNGKEHNEVKKDGKKRFWCTDGHKFNGEAVGVYCNHRPGAEHVAWRAKVDAWKEKRREKRQKSGGGTPAGGPPKPGNDDSKPSAQGVGKKLALGNSLQAVLTTGCGLTPDAFNTMWNKCCSESGN